MGSAADSSSTWWTTCPNGRQCPNYRDSWKESYCCKSKVKPGDFYCCDYATKSSNDYQGLLQEHLPELVGGLIGTTVLLLIVVFAMCFYCKCCALYKKRKHNHGYDGSPSLSRNVNCIVHGVWSPVPRQVPFYRYPPCDSDDLVSGRSPPPEFQRKSCGTPPPPYSSVCESRWTDGRYAPTPV